jgi:hypothetical protein
LEQLARNGDLAAAAEILPQLEDKTAAFIQSLREIREEVAGITAGHGV